MVFALLDCSGILLVFLPLFGEKTGGMVRAVSLLHLEGIGSYLQFAYWAVALGMILSGGLRLLLQNTRHPLWLWCRDRGSFQVHGLGVLLLIISQQPYAAAFLFLLLGIKVLIVLKKP